MHPQAQHMQMQQQQMAIRQQQQQVMMRQQQQQSIMQSTQPQLPTFGPHPLPQQQQPMAPSVPLASPPTQPQPQLPVAPRPSLNPALCNFSVQQSSPLFAGVLVRSENFDPLASWMPWIAWDGCWMDTYPLQTEFRTPAARLADCVQVLMSRGFAPVQGRLAARIPPFPPSHSSSSFPTCKVTLMLRRGQMVLATCLVVAVGGVIYITDQQRVEKERMHRAVIVDKQRIAQVEARRKQQRQEAEAATAAAAGVPSPSTSRSSSS